jgi:hypothetical protein
MKKFPVIETQLEREGVFVDLTNPEIELEPEPEPEPELPKRTPDEIFVKPKTSKASEKQLAHLETIRAKALLARQNKKKAVKGVSPPNEVLTEEPPPPPPIIKETPNEQLYTKAELDDYVKNALVSFHEKERDKRIAEVRKKQAELEEQRKKYDVSHLLKKQGGRGLIF